MDLSTPEPGACALRIAALFARPVPRAPARGGNVELGIDVGKPLPAFRAPSGQAIDVARTSYEANRPSRLRACPRVIVSRKPVHAYSARTSRAIAFVDVLCRTSDTTRV